MVGRRDGQGHAQAGVAGTRGWLARRGQDEGRRHVVHPGVARHESARGFRGPQACGAPCRTSTAMVLLRQVQPAQAGNTLHMWFCALGETHNDPNPAARPRQSQSITRRPTCSAVLWVLKFAIPLNGTTACTRNGLVEIAHRTVGGARIAITHHDPWRASPTLSCAFGVRALCCVVNECCAVCASLGSYVALMCYVWSALLVWWCCLQLVLGH